jgi:hypothetical protein
VKALREHDPDTQFTAASVKVWAEEYAKASEVSLEDIPQALRTTYGIGRFLKKYGTMAHIIPIGSYANRTVFGLEDLEDAS